MNRPSGSYVPVNDSIAIELSPKKQRRRHEKTISPSRLEKRQERLRFAGQNCTDSLEQTLLSKTSNLGSIDVLSTRTFKTRQHEERVLRALAFRKKRKGLPRDQGLEMLGCLVGREGGLVGKEFVKQELCGIFLTPSN
jgi:hypothetical protein